MTATVLSQLQQHPFVSGFDARQIERLAAMAKEARFPRDHVIFHEGDQDPELYLIVKGLVALEIDAPEQVVRVQTLEAGDEFGWSAVLMGKGKHFQARTLEPVEALMFRGDQLLAAFHDDARLGLAFTLRLLAVVSERFQATRLHLIDKYSPVAKRAGN